MNYLTSSGFAFVGLFFLYILCSRIYLVYDTRRRYQDIPSLPRHWLFGNLKSIGEKCSPSSNRHPDYGFEEIWDELGRPPCFMVDLAPIDSHSFLVVCDPGIAETIAQPSPEFKWSLPKSNTYEAMRRLIGRGSLISAEGETWKSLRKRFNKGFAPGHLHGLSPLILSKTVVFIDRLKEAARTGVTLPLKDLAQDLTTDIITQITMEKDFQAQSVPDGEGPKSRFGILTAARISSKLVTTAGQGLDLMAWVNVVKLVQERLYEWIYDKELYSVLSQKLHQEHTQPKKVDASAKAIVQLALADMEPSPSLLQNTVSQIKTFLFAGQDTTATMIQWLCFELSKADHDPRYRQIVDKLAAEHDSVFGAGAYSALEILSQPGQAEEYLGDRIAYTTAFIKETLRLHPPGATARQAPDVSKTIPPFYVDINGKHAEVNGLRVYNCLWLLQRNPKVWGEDAHIFNPDRFLDEASMAKLPPGAWRPFERGPRNCIGQELAILEAKVVLCAVTRALRFEKVGLTGRDGEPEVWNIQNVTPVPVDGMKMRYHLKE